MRILIQRVSQATVRIDGQLKSAIGPGLLIFLGIETHDTQQDIDWLVRKVSQLRIFNDAHGKMNLSVKDIHGQILVISQFTLMASTKKGNRPSYIRAARPEQAIPLYHAFIRTLEAVMEQPIATGEFGANMQVQLCNDGPVTIWIDSKNPE